MASLTVELEIAPEIYERAKQIAQEQQRSIEVVLQESLALLFGVSQATLPTADNLTHYSDEALWAIVHRHLAWHQETILRDLVAQSKQSTLSDRKFAEMEHLIDQVDQYMLLRSQALVLLKQRGHNVQHYLQLGV
jgi:hypothetical protein